MFSCKTGREPGSSCVRSIIDPRLRGEKEQQPQMCAVGAGVRALAFSNQHNTKGSYGQSVRLPFFVRVMVRRKDTTR